MWCPISRGTTLPSRMRIIAGWGTAIGWGAASAARITRERTIATAATVLLAGAPASAAADFDLDGRVDLVAVAADGSVHFLRNDTKTAHHWIRVMLTGVKNLALAPDAQVEVKAG